MHTTNRYNNKKDVHKTLSFRLIKSKRHFLTWFRIRTTRQKVVASQTKNFAVFLFSHLLRLPMRAPYPSAAWETERKKINDFSLWCYIMRTAGNYFTSLLYLRKQAGSKHVRIFFQSVHFLLLLRAFFTVDGLDQDRIFFFASVHFLEPSLSMGILRIFCFHAICCVFPKRNCTRFLLNFP